MSKEFYEKLKKLNGLPAHAKPDATYAELLDHLASQELKRIEKKKGITAFTAAAAVVERPNLPKGKRVYLAVVLTRPIWQRAHGGSNNPENLRLACCATTSG